MAKFLPHFITQKRTPITEFIHSTNTSVHLCECDLHDHLMISQSTFSEHLLRPPDKGQPTPTHVRTQDSFLPGLWMEKSKGRASHCMVQGSVCRPDLKSWASLSVPHCYKWQFTFSRTESRHTKSMLLMGIFLVLWLCL